MTPALPKLPAAKMPLLLFDAWPSAKETLTAPVPPEPSALNPKLLLLFICTR